MLWIIGNIMLVIFAFILIAMVAFKAYNGLDNVEIIEDNTDIISEDNER